MKPKLRPWLEYLENKDLLRRVKKTVSPTYELAAVGEKARTAPRRPV